MRMRRGKSIANKYSNLMIGRTKTIGYEGKTYAMELQGKNRVIYCVPEVMANEMWMKINELYPLLPETDKDKILAQCVIKKGEKVFIQNGK